MHRIPDWSALDATGRRRRQEAARGRAHALDPVLNAFAQINSAPPPSPLAARLGGLPYAAKDMFRTPSHNPGGGIGGTGELGIAGNSELLERLGAAGADLIGFTNMTELAYEPSGFNATRGRVRNPWKLDFISGGSSSGSAAAVASGAVVAALGSDTGGSLRIPAHACGLTAWKPTHGLVSVAGAMPLAPTLDTIGLLARSAEDMKTLVPIIAELPQSKGIGRAIVPEDVVAECDPAVRRAVADSVAAIEGAGIPIERRSALAAIETIDRHSLIVMQGESTDAALVESVNARAKLVRDFEEQVLAGSNVVVLPIMAILTPRADECDPASERFSPRTLYALSRFTRFVNMLGFPAVALPAGFDRRGLPLGVQIVGRAGSDLALLDLARHVQSKTDWHARVPTAIAHLVPESQLPS